MARSEAAIPPNLTASIYRVAGIASCRPILLKNSLSVTRRFFSVIEIQPKTRDKHDARPPEKD
jgi:hypothetical protein